MPEYNLTQRERQIVIRLLELSQQSKERFEARIVDPVRTPWWRTTSSRPVNLRISKEYPLCLGRQGPMLILGPECSWMTLEACRMTR